jgi:hypothetical protein
MLLAEGGHLCGGALVDDRILYLIGDNSDSGFRDNPQVFGVEIQ